MMEHYEAIDQYDLVEIIQVPEKYLSLMDVGDVGVVVEKYDDFNFEVECVQPGGVTKWLGTVNIQHLKLRSKDPYDPWVKKTLGNKLIMRESIRLGALVGLVCGGLIGAALGAITMTFNGILVGLVIGLILGAVTGALTAALTVKTAGTTGGIGVGYFVGMLFGGAFGLIVGALIPTSLRMRAQTQGLPVLDALMLGRFETAALLAFPLSILATIVGIWISGKNFVPRNLKERYRP